MNKNTLVEKPFINHPIRFTPIILEKIWGGTKLHSLLGKDVGDIIDAGESWEISAVEGHLSVVSTGEYKGLNIKQILTFFGVEILGKDLHKQFGNKFPLLIKFLDSKEDLSIQVHPSDEKAMARHNSLGKTELWYVIDAEENSKIISGFNKTITQTEYLQRLDDHSLEEVLDSDNSEKGFSYFIPAGRIHALGAGNVVAEVQQTSDITYRIFDYNRIDKNGKTRELHTEQALDCINFSVDKSLNKRNTPNANELTCIATCNHFTTNVLRVEGEKVFDFLQRPSFTILIIIDGSGLINYNGLSELIKKGDTLLLPAQFNKFSITSTKTPLDFLEVYI